jgi:mono/diheme cytochrome c family protein
MSARKFSRRMSLVGGVFALFGLIGIGCAAIQTGATPDELAKARDQATQGANVFASECASCHGDRGQGVGGVPAILGPGALPENPRSSVASSNPGMGDPQLLQLQAQSRPAGAAWRDPFRTGQDLFAFLTTHMPMGHVGQLKPVDYWAVTGFMLAVQGAPVHTAGIGPANANSIQIPRR